MENLVGIRDSYGQAIVDLAQEDERIVALASDSKYSSKLDVFEERFPERFFEVGVCEQNMVGMAAGLSLSGRIPFISAIACFMSMRCYEIVRTAVGYPKLNVKLVGMSSGFAYPQLGATHTCLEDVSIMRAASNITVISPADNFETYAATKAMAFFEGPVYMRLGRHPVPDIYDKSYEFVIGKGSLLREGMDASIIAVGPAVPYALEAHLILKRDGINARVINMSSIKPLDERLAMSAAKETGRIVTVEEHNIAGGMGSAVAEFLIQKCPVKMKLLGIPNETPNAAPRDVLLDRYHLTAPAIAAAVRELL
jgi:transketolase